MKHNHLYNVYVKAMIPNDYNIYCIKLCENIFTFYKVSDIKSYINDLTKNGAKVYYFYKKVW